MTYYDSAEGITISRQRARQELARHGLADHWDDMTSELGDRDSYDAQSVLLWLGY